VAFIWPQVWRSVRHDTTHGLSPFALIHGLAGSMLWLAYGIMKHDAAVWFSNTSFMTAQSIIIFMVYRHGRIPRLIIFRSVAALLLSAYGLSFLSAPTVGVMAIIISGSSCVPQLIYVFKNENLHGISLMSYGTTIAACTSWAVYGVVVSDIMVSLQNFFTIPVLSFIMLKAWRWRVANPDWSQSAVAA
jgi:MtN3 and saliva related transmembrane protein